MIPDANAPNWVEIITWMKEGEQLAIARCTNVCQAFGFLSPEMSTMVSPTIRSAIS